MILGYLGELKSIPLLCDIVVNNKDAGMRFYSIKYLSNIGDKRSIPALKKALSDDYRDSDGNYRLRDEAYRALQKMGVKVVSMGNGNYKVEN